jgi:hypothetical protein
VTCAFPVEALLAAIPDAHGPGDRTFGIYGGLAELAGARDPWSVDHPEVTAGTVTGSGGGLTTVTNHGARALDVELRLPGVRRASLATRQGLETLATDGDRAPLSLEGYGAAAVVWRE